MRNPSAAHHLPQTSGPTSEFLEISAPDGLLQILNGRNPGVALYLGDNVDDALAAKAAKMPFVGILPRRSEERRQRGALLRKLGALTILSDISELESFLKP